MILQVIIAISLASILVSIFLFSRIIKKSPGSEKMKHISDLINKGALEFLRKEYRILILVLILAALILLVIDYKLSISFVVGSSLSLLAGNISMRVATKANSRTAEAARIDINHGFRLAFLAGIAGSVFSLSLAMFGIIIVYLIFGTHALISLAFGASFVALFMRVGGGIFTKSADIAADLSGKVEAGIPEDDPRNPAVLADLVGDNVGDIAGMGSDLFESFVSSIISVMAISAAVTESIYLPLVIGSIGIAASLFSGLFVRGKRIHRALLIGFLINALIVAVIAFLISELNTFYSLMTGIFVGVIVGFNTNYFTSINNRPVRKISKASEKGAALNIIAGLANGMVSSIIPVIVVSIGIMASFNFYGVYGIAMAAVGMLSIMTLTLASDIYGSIADNAAGISQFSKLKNAREATDKLDELGNSAAAMGKGFDVASAALTSLALLAAYLLTAGISSIDLAKAENISVLFMGTILPFIFSAYTMDSVGRGSDKLITEVRKQFRNRGVLSGKKEPDYNRCIDITTEHALKSMIIPSLAAIFVPVIIGLLFGKEALGSFIIGSIATSFLLATFMSNAGASLDNAKKYIELGNYGGKGSEAHKASVIGDTVGDPLKDTAGPSLNILIKLMAITALIFAGL